jgi:hypothetical protein
MECLDAIALTSHSGTVFPARALLGEMTGDVRFRDALTVPPQALVVGPFSGSLYWPSPI